jgi:hypothetical protein
MSPSPEAELGGIAARLALHSRRRRPPAGKTRRPSTRLAIPSWEVTSFEGYRLSLIAHIFAPVSVPETSRTKIVARLEREGWQLRHGGRHDIYFTGRSMRAVRSFVGVVLTLGTIGWLNAAPSHEVGSDVPVSSPMIQQVAPQNHEIAASTNWIKGMPTRSREIPHPSRGSE